MKHAETCKDSTVSIGI